MYRLPVTIDGPRTQPVSVPPGPSWSDLECILGIYGNQRFEAQFGFPYRDDSTHPKDIAPYGGLSGVASLFTEAISQPDDLPNLIPECILRCEFFRFIACKHAQLYFVAK